ncbi:hypothetical protein AB1Y20_009478 [Prymnesium parvum]|uniref:Calpain catalytic domain-containing protein n=1 Tax=Prymnesium parvum TaxID=97485 RepID=A0AB34K4E0_PRYPA
MGRLSIEIPLPRIPPNWTRKELENGEVLIFIEELEGGAVLQFYAESAGPRRLTFVIDFRESSEICVQHAGAGFSSRHASMTDPHRARTSTLGEPESHEEPWWRGAFTNTERVAHILADSTVDQIHGVASRGGNGSAEDFRGAAAGDEAAANEGSVISGGVEFEGGALQRVDAAHPSAGTPDDARVRAPSEAAESLVARAVVMPHTRQLVCRVEKADPSSNMPLRPRYKYSWVLDKLKEKERRVLLNTQAEHVARLEREMKEIAASSVEAAQQLLAKTEGSSYAALRLVMQQKGQSFIDLDFPPTQRSIDGVKKPEGLSLLKREQPAWWKRPEEFLLGEEQQVFHAGLAPSDVQQGSLGNCWFLCSVCALVEFPHLVRALFAERWFDSSDPSLAGCPKAAPDGMYELRLCKTGQWRSVWVDDIMPCYPGINTKPMFSQAVGPELWVLLLEKAYAKLHGSYLALRTGMCFEGLHDLTGAPTFYRRLEETPVTFEQLLEWDEAHCLICCCTPGVDKITERGGALGRQRGRGLVPGHAYTIIRCVTLQQPPNRGKQLVQLRNPWGDYEWSGEWSDQSAQMTPAVRAELSDSSSSDVHDGVFWMCFEDWKRHFISVSVCAPHVPSGGTPRVWSAELIQRRKSFLVQHKDDGAADGVYQPVHNFHLSVEAQEDEEVTCFIGVHQLDERTPVAPAYVDVGFALQKLLPNGRLEPVVGAVQPSAVQRDQHLLVKLKSGRYLITPTTSGADPGQRKGSESLRDAAREISRTQGASFSYSRELPHAVKLAFEQGCFCLDADVDGKLGSTDLGQPMAAEFVRTAGIDISSGGTAEGGVKLAHFGGYIEPMALLDALWLSWPDNAVERRARLCDTLASLGYDEALQLTRLRPIMITVHSSSPVGLTPVNAENDQDEQTKCSIVIASGKPQELREGITLYLMHSSGGVSFAAENTSKLDVGLKLDCSRSANVRANRSTLKPTIHLPAGSKRLALVLLPADRMLPWQYKYRCSLVHARSAADVPYSRGSMDGGALPPRPEVTPRPEGDADVSSGTAVANPESPPIAFKLPPPNYRDDVNVEGGVKSELSHSLEDTPEHTPSRRPHEWRACEGWGCAFQ